MRVALLFGPLAPHLAASTTVSLEWYSDSPLTLSFEILGLRWLLLYQTSLPHLIISRTIGSERTQ
jgi:hypothetical protein